MLPIGITMIFHDNDDHSNHAGKTWERTSVGRVPVGIDTTQTEFDTIGKTGGAKTHTLTAAELASHRHPMARQDGGASSQIVVPIGVWRLRYKVVLWGSGQDGKVTLSTTNNSETIPALTHYLFNGMAAIGSTEAIVSPTSKTTYYPIVKSSVLASLRFYNSHGDMVIFFTCAYL